MTADLVLLGGRILTFADWVPGGPSGEASALAVRGGEIVAVGDDAHVRERIGQGTRVVELHGCTVIPGINDTHLHLVCLGMARHGLLDVSAGALGDWAGLSRVLTADAIGADGWIRANGWDAAAFGRAPTAPDVDAALQANGIADVPVVLFDSTGHQLLVGSAALERIGVVGSTPDPPGGIIVRDAGGEPSGIFADAAMRLVLESLPLVPVETLVAVLRRALADLGALGITSLTDPGIGPGHTTLFDGSASELGLEALAQLAERDELTLRVATLLTFSGTGGESVATVRAGLEGSLPRALDHLDPRILRMAGIKIFADGIQRSGTSWHREPYGPARSRGQLAVSGATDAERTVTLRAVLQMIGAAGWQVGVHATGDAASDAVVAALLAGPETSTTRPYLIHGDFLPADGMAELASAGIGWTANPVISTMVAGIGMDLLGPNRQRARQPLHSALQSGVTVTLSSDAPVVSADWRPAVVAAVERTQTDGNSHPGDREAVSGIDALAMLTVTPARLDGAEAWKGRLAPGFAADFAVLDSAWPADARIVDLLGIGVDLTVVGGRIVNDRENWDTGVIP